MKLFNSVLLMVILCGGGIQSINGEALQCIFGDVTYLETLYTCSVSVLENPNDNKIITGYSGNHQSNKSDRDVKQLYIDNTNTEYIPEGLGSLFDLIALAITNSKLNKIRSRDFQRMQNLELLSLFNNSLTSLPWDAFLTLKKLKKILLDYNKLRFLGSGVFDHLTKLEFVNLRSNICVNNEHHGASGIIQMKRDIIANCKNTNEIPTTTTTKLNEIEQKITEEIRYESTKASEKNQEQFKILNEMIKTLLKATEENQKDHDEIGQLKSELSTAKNEQKKEHYVNIKVTKERDQLFKELTELTNELTEAKETIHQKLPKMEQTINEFHMEVMDQKIERHHQRELYREIRSKLMEANEQLAECKINERISC